ncbi:TPA: Tn7 transposase TnsA N-terminal domain-containing protein, partial [Vibrio antiquarius]
MKKRILKNSSVKNISRFVSIKNDSIETVESDLEFDACFHFEFNPHLVYFEAQPIGYKYLLNKKLHRYTPDFLCRFSDGYERYYEIKYKDEVDTEEFKEKFEVQRLQAISMGRDLQ